MKQIEKVLEKIRVERFKKGYTQYYMGSQLDMSQRAYGMTENGKTALKVKVLIKIIAILELSPKEVFKG